MQKRGRVLRVGKWAAVISSAALLGIWVASYASAVFVPVDFGEIVVSRGVVTVFENEYLGAHSSFRVREPSDYGEFDPHYDDMKWNVGFAWKIQQMEWDRTCIALWFPFVLSAVPTALIWYRDWRRIPVGHCRRCGYDLTKNESGICPECGVGIDPPTGLPRSPTRTQSGMRL